MATMIMKIRIFKSLHWETDMQAASLIYRPTWTKTSYLSKAHVTRDNSSLATLAISVGLQQ